MILDVAVIHGDGVGPEMVASAVAVLAAVCRKFGHQVKISDVLAGGAAIEFCGNPLPDDSLALCQSVPAVLFGNIGLAKYRSLPLEKRPEQALMKLRRGKGVTTNIRPVKLYPELAFFSPLKERIISKGLDFVFVRDIMGGVLCSEKVKTVGEYGKEAYEYEYYNEQIVMETARIAFDLAMKRRKKVISLDKSNVLESSRLWRSTIQDIGTRYPDVELVHAYIDTAAMQIIDTPQVFDVIVTSNLFGDIISDEGTQMTGTPLLYASAELSKDGGGIYTPNQLHFPDESLIGKGVVNPVGMIAAVALMLRFTFGLEEAAQIVEQAITQVIADGSGTGDIWQEGRILLNTSEFGVKIVEEINRL